PNGIKRPRYVRYAPDNLYFCTKFRQIAPNPPADGLKSDRLLGQGIALNFVVDPALLAGVRLSLGAWQLDFSLAGELAFFAQASTSGECAEATHRAQ
ncbi:hypothetical protein, partial [Rhodocyclus purpureus]|uniref:hypothetical protein n=1 Tax=Rhodocyclus purpureus TaxID=1067 RepID=UPI00191352DB